MMYDELKQQLQNNILSYMNTVKPEYLDIDRGWVYDDLCMVIEDTFDEAFFAPAPYSLDTAD